MLTVYLKNGSTVIRHRKLYCKYLIVLILHSDACIDNISIDNQSQSIISDISTSSILNYESSNTDTISDTTDPTYTHINKPTLQSISDDITEIKRLLTKTNKPTYAEKLIKSTNDMIKTNLNVGEGRG